MGYAFCFEKDTEFNYYLYRITIQLEILIQETIKLLQKIIGIIRNKTEFSLIKSGFFIRLLNLLFNVRLKLATKHENRVARCPVLDWTVQFLGYILKF